MLGLCILFITVSVGILLFVDIRRNISQRIADYEPSICNIHLLCLRIVYHVMMTDRDVHEIQLVVLLVHQPPLLPTPFSNIRG